MTFKIAWHDSGREPQCRPDPAYPEGKDLDMCAGGTGCWTPLDYPAPRCGVYVIECTKCGMTVGVTTAGRPDDPRSVRLPCKRKLQ